MVVQDEHETHRRSHIRQLTRFNSYPIINNATTTTTTSSDNINIRPGEKRTPGYLAMFGEDERENPGYTDHAKDPIADDVSSSKSDSKAEAAAKLPAHFPLQLHEMLSNAEAGGYSRKYSDNLPIDQLCDPTRRHCFSQLERSLYCSAP